MSEVADWDAERGSWWRYNADMMRYQAGSGLAWAMDGTAEQVATTLEEHGFPLAAKALRAHAAAIVSARC